MIVDCFCHLEGDSTMPHMGIVQPPRVLFIGRGITSSSCLSLYDAIVRRNLLANHLNLLPPVIIMYRPDRHPHHQNVAQPWRGVAPLALRLYPLWFHLPQLLRPEEGLALLHASLHIFEARVKMLGELFGVAPPLASARDVYERFWRSPPIASSRALAGVVAASSFCLTPPSISGVILSIATVTEGFFLSSLE
mmetsp:Transcript_5410/g.13558  ORF Transcript_5410/g.13558 Transcript_5410/m.13558 type:complete len:193 (+) Transcript_5410:88-666(+)